MHIKKYGNSLFSVYDPLGEKLLRCLKLIFSHTKEHKFRHGFADMINPMCASRAEDENTEHFLLHCHFYSTQRSELRDYFRLKLTPTFGQCPKWLIFFKKLFYWNNCKEAKEVKDDPKKTNSDFQNLSDKVSFMLMVQKQILLKILSKF